MMAEELVALAELLERTPLTKAERLWVAGLLRREREEIVERGKAENAEGVEREE